MASRRSARIRPQLMMALVDVITGGSGMGGAPPPVGIYRSGPEIVRFFKRNGIDDVYGNWSRVPHTEEKLEETQASPGGRTKILHLIEDSVNPADYVDQDKELKSAVAHLNKYLAFDDLELRRNGRAHRVYRTKGMTPAVAKAQSAAEELDFEACRQEFDRAIDNVQRDPGASVTAACSLLESIAKIMLDRLDEPLPPDQTIAPLLRALSRRLRLLPEDQDDQDVRRAIGGLGNVVAGIGALRTKFGSAHGRGQEHAQPDRVLAEFCVNSASAVGLFLLHRYAAEKEDD